jgi:hypothetical protein
MSSPPVSCVYNARCVTGHRLVPGQPSASVAAAHVSGHASTPSPYQGLPELERWTHRFAVLAGTPGSDSGAPRTCREAHMRRRGGVTQLGDTPPAVGPHLQRPLSVHGARGVTAARCTPIGHALLAAAWPANADKYTAFKAGGCTVYTLYIHPLLEVTCPREDPAQFRFCRPPRAVIPTLYDAARRYNRPTHTRSGRVAGSQS